MDKQLSKLPKLTHRCLPDFAGMSRGLLW